MADQPKHPDPAEVEAAVTRSTFHQRGLTSAVDDCVTLAAEVKALWEELKLRDKAMEKAITAAVAEEAIYSEHDEVGAQYAAQDKVESLDDLQTEHQRIHDSLKSESETTNQ